MAGGNSQAVDYLDIVPEIRHTDPEKLLPWLPEVQAAVDRLREFQPATEEEANEQLCPYLETLRKSLWTSPHAIHRLREHGLSPNDLQRPCDLSPFPMLTRADWAQYWRDLPIHPPEPLWVAVPSSGSTGAPVLVVKSAFDQVHMWAVLDFLLEKRSLTRPHDVALLCTLPSGMEYEAELPLFHHAHLTRISTQRPDPWRRLAALSSPILFTDPGGLHWLLGQAPLRPSVVLTSASHLSDHLRSEAENHLQCQVIDYYATTEVGAIAADCIHHQKHVLSPEVFVESVEGELVVTRLRPGAIPILRYRTGDSGQVVWKDCTCGTSGWVIPSFSGRHACWFINPRGEQVDAWQFAWLFKHHAVHTFRMTQESSSDFTIELLGSGTTELHSHLVEALARKGWLDAAIRYVEGVANTPGNKPQPFVSRLSP